MRAPALERALAQLGAALDRWALHLPPLLRAFLLGPVLYGAAVGGSMFALLHPELAGAIARNRPRLGEVTTSVGYVAAAAAAFVAIVGLVHRQERREGGALEAAAYVGRLFSPLLALPCVVALRFPAIERERPALTLFLVVLAAASCARGMWAVESGTRDDARDPSHEGTARACVAVALAALWAGYAFLFSRLSIANHHALNTRILDLGLYDNVFYQSSHGRPLGCSFLRGGTHASAHFDPLLVLLSPLYRLYPHAELLLVLQSVWLGGGVVPVYLIAGRRLESRAAGLVFAASYVLHPALHGANLAEFHSLSFVTPLLLWLLYLCDTRARRATFAVLALALLCREDVPLLLAVVGCVALCEERPEKRRTGWIILAASLAYFAVVKGLLMPSSELFNAGPRSYGYAYYFEDLIPHNRGLVDIALSLLTNPAFVIGDVLTGPKVLFVAELFVPLLCLPLLAKPGRGMLLYGVSFCLLASDPDVFSNFSHFGSLVLPVAFAVAPDGLGRMQAALSRRLDIDEERVRRTALAGVLVASALASWKFGAIVENQAFRGQTGAIVRELSEEQEETFAWVEATEREIPADASLWVTPRTGPHASNRADVRIYPRGVPADFLFLHEADMPAQEVAKLRERVESGELVEVARRGPMMLLRRR